MKRRYVHALAVGTIISVICLLCNAYLLATFGYIWDLNERVVLRISGSQAASDKHLMQEAKALERRIYWLSLAKVLIDKGFLFLALGTSVSTVTVYLISKRKAPSASAAEK